jgi:hypothetical protein
VPQTLMKAFSDLDGGNFNPELDMKYTQRLKKYQHEYEEHVRTGVLARILDKDKGDLVYWYETITESFDNNKKLGKRRKAILSNLKT